MSDTRSKAIEALAEAITHVFGIDPLDSPEEALAYLDAHPEAKARLHHWMHPCGLPDGHNGDCWYESGTEDD